LRGRAIGGVRSACQAQPHPLVTAATGCDETAMASDGKNTGNTPAQTREERLAAQLRANLRRRKAQARAISASDAHESAPDAGDCVPDGDET